MSASKRQKTAAGGAAEEGGGASSSTLNAATGKEQDFTHLLPPHWREEVHGWVRDDVPSIDIGGFVVGEKDEEAYLYGKSDGVLAGVPFFDAVFDHLGCTVEWRKQVGPTTPGGADDRDPPTTDYDRRHYRRRSSSSRCRCRHCYR